MTPSEVVLRAGRAARNRCRRPTGPVPVLELADLERVLDARELPEGDRSVGAVRRVLDDGRGSLLRGALEADALARELAAIGSSTARVVAAADGVLAGRLPAFGWTTFETGYPPDWHADPLSGRSWPETYWAELDFRFEPGLEEPRYVWEINRQHELATLGRAWVLTRDERYARAVWESMRSWADRNPPFFGINWTSALEVALRLISWALAIDLVGTVGATDEDVRTVLASASLQAAHLSDNLSVYASSRNNHLIGEAAGLVVAGSKFSFLTGAARWRASGAGHVRREVAGQVAPDGVSREQAVHYGAFVTEFALVAAAALRMRGGELPVVVRERLGAMSGFLGALASEGGAVPEIGDADGGRVYELSDARGRQVMRAAACAALETGGWLPHAATDEDLEPALWLSGPAAVREELDAKRDRRTRESDAFREGGYFVLARREAQAVVDCGELGYLSIAAHGHADCLSVLYAVGGRWVVVDPGTYCYHGSRDWRDHFRSTGAHNTVAIDGRSQSEMLGPFMWGARAGATQRFWGRTPLGDVFEGSHDGYARAGVTHQRLVAMLPGGACVVVDRLEGRGRHAVASGFQLAAGCTASESVASLERLREFVVADERGEAMTLHVSVPSGCSCDVVAGVEEPPSGWVSGGFGDRTDAPRVRVTGELELPATLIAAFVPGGAGAGATVRLEADDGEGAAISIGAGTRRERLLAGRVATGDIAFHGDFGITIEEGLQAAPSTTPLGAVGSNIEEWTIVGEAVDFEKVLNQLKSTRR